MILLNIRHLRSHVKQVVTIQGCNSPRGSKIEHHDPANTMQHVYSNFAMENLPTELIREIVSFLPLESLSALASSCVSVNKLLESEFLWSFLVQLRFGSAEQGDNKTLIPAGSLPGRACASKRLYRLFWMKSREIMCFHSEPVDQNMLVQGEAAVVCSTFMIGARQCGKRSVVARLLENSFWDHRLWNGPAIEFRIATFTPDPNRVQLSVHHPWLQKKVFKLMVRVQPPQVSRTSQTHESVTHRAVVICCPIILRFGLSRHLTRSSR